MGVTKIQVLESLRSEVAELLAKAIEAQRDVQRGATHEEARPENDKDTRALEAPYLARGLAERVAVLESANHELSKLQLRPFGSEDPVALGALVTLERCDDGDERRYFVVPAAGGMELQVEGQTITTVTPAAPVGRALIGSYLGDELQVRTPQGPRDMEVVGLG